jgi:hypothetical protein
MNRRAAEFSAQRCAEFCGFEFRAFASISVAAYFVREIEE